MRRRKVSAAWATPLDELIVTAGLDMISRTNIALLP
jgi:hypothetical protein